MKSVYRLVPCPQYDVSGMECWLSEMAEQGLILVQDGIFCGVATFEKGTPQKVRYCLQAASQSTSMWADNMGDPDAEEVELSKEFGWEYVAKRGEFHIYRTSDPFVRELHTDREVKALAMNAMKKRQKDNILNSLFYGIFYPWLIMRGKIILSMIHAGTLTISILLIAGLWMTFHSVIQAAKLIKLRKKVLNDQSLGSAKDWKKGVKAYFANNIFRKCLYIIAICLLLNLFGANISNKYYVPLTEYTKELPFKTMKDFIPNGEMELMNMQVGNLNTVREWSDVLSDVNYEWDEAGTVSNSDGTILSGGLEVIYHETKADWIAKRLVKEYLRKAKGEREFEPLEIHMEELDQAVAYTTITHFPNVILRNENKVICARFYTSGEKSVTYELEEWAGFLAESILD